MGSFEGKSAVAYLRWSRDEQSASLGQQKSVLERWAQQNGATIIEWVQDDGISGTLRENRRPGLARLLDRIRNRSDFQLVLCYDLSRFGRFQDGNVYGYYFVLARDASKEFYFIQENASSRNNDIGQVVMRVIAAHGAGEKSRITASGAIRGQIERARRGRIVGGVPPDGFDHMVVDRSGQAIERHRYIRPGLPGQRNASVWHILTPEGKLIREIVGPPPKQKSCEITLVPGAPERVEAVRMIFEMFGREGKGYKQIAHTLNRKRIPSPRGNVWEMGGVRALLMNPAYAGKAAFNLRTSAKVYRIANRPDTMGNDHTKIEQEDSEREKPRWNPREDWIVVADAFPSPVSKELAQRVSDRLALIQGTCTACEPGAVISRESRSSGLLAGFIVCAKCGRYYRTHTWTWTLTDPRTRKTIRKKNYNYVCARYEDGGAEACARLYVKREVLEAPVLDWIRKRFLDPSGRKKWEADLREMEARLADSRSAADERRAILERQIADIEARVVAVMRDATPATVTDTEREVQRLRGEAEALRSQLGLVPPAPGKSGGTKHKLTVDSVMTLIEEFRKHFEGAGRERQKRILRSFVKGITVDPDRREVTIDFYRVPPLPGGAPELAEGWYPHDGLQLPQQCVQGALYHHAACLTLPRLLTIHPQDVFLAYHLMALKEFGITGIRQSNEGAQGRFFRRKPWKERLVSAGGGLAA